MEENGFFKYFWMILATTRDKTFEMQDDGKAKLGQTDTF